MMRNSSFQSSHEPFYSQDAIELQEPHTTGPFSFLNPTRAHLRLTALPQQPSSSDTAHQNSTSNGDASNFRNEEQYFPSIAFKWRSRDNRKGRHVLVVAPPKSADYTIPKPTSTLREICRGILRMTTQYPYWDVSFLVAEIFTLSSVVWVLNAFLVYLPLAKPQTEFRTEILYGGGITAFIGATIFEVGSILLMLEAVNENRTGCFGWALEQVLEGHDEKGDRIAVRPEKNGCSHHHTNKKNLVGKSNAPQTPTSLLPTTLSHSPNGFTVDPPKQPQSTSSKPRTWIWYPTIHDLQTHYLHELGFLACLAQFLGVTTFWIAGFTALPGINNALASQNLLDGIYWAPQILGGTGFIISGILFMLETQARWYQPAFGVLGWHIGFWNLVGAFGFTLCGALGPAYGSSGAQYEASLVTFWGSWAFLIGSLVQWYESLDKYPVEKVGLKDLQKMQ